MWSPPLLPSAEPFLLSGNLTCCLHVNGITSTPKEMHWLDEAPKKRGIKTLKWWLNGHATRRMDLIRSRWKDWFADLKDGWQIFTRYADQIYVIGLSMGGTLSLLFSTSFPVKGIVVLAVAHCFPNEPQLPFLEPVSFLWKYREKNPPLWHIPQAKNEHISYNRESFRALAELRDLINQMQTALPHIIAPAQLTYSKNDPNFRAEDQHTELIYQALVSKLKQNFHFENSGHVITLDFAPQESFTAMINFIEFPCCRRA